MSRPVSNNSSRKLSEPMKSPDRSPTKVGFIPQNSYGGVLVTRREFELAQGFKFN